MEVAKNLEQVRARIEKACAECNRAPSEITLVAVSKSKPVESVLRAFSARQIQFGENYLQEALDKINMAQLQPNVAQEIVWHYLGPIQTNKTRKIAENFTWVHSVSREVEAIRLNDQRPANLPPLNVCVQVNISEEKSKSGLLAEDVENFLPCFSSLDRLVLRGLMVIPKQTEDQAEQEKIYQTVQMLYNELQARGWPLDTLSMGMSHDLEMAIKYGSTMVRVGQAIFGKRQ